MIYNHLKIAWRNISRNRMLSLINIGGLSIGIATSFLILQYVQFERSFDQFHEKKDRIFRLHWSFYQNGQETLALPKAAAGAGPRLLADFPELEAQTRIFKVSGTVNVSHEDRAFNESRVLFASKDFLNIFSYPLLHGDPRHALDGPNKVVISRSAAARYFPGIDNPVGQPLSIKEGKTVDWSLLVTGVMEDLPAHTHMEAEVIASYETFSNFQRGAESSMTWVNFYTYLLASAGTTQDELDTKLEAWIAAVSEFEKFNEGDRPKAYVWPLTDIHLHSNFTQEIKATGDARVVAILMGAAFFILVIAWLNYINLTTAKGLERAREVGVKKVVGASRQQLLLQFLLEAFVINCISLVIAFTLYQVCQPLLKSMLTTAPGWRILFQGELFWYTLAVVATGSFMSGFYPAATISAYRPAMVLKGKTTHSQRGHLLRKLIVSLQFGLSLILLVATFTVRKQIGFMLSQDLGLNPEQVLVVLAPDAYTANHEEKTRLFREAALALPGISEVSESLVVPGEEMYYNYAAQVNGKLGASIDFGQGSIDPYYIPLMGMQILAGRNFNPELETDRRSVILNESAMATLQFNSPDSAIGKKIYWMDSDGVQWTIIGVVKNHHHLGLSRKVEPVIYYMQDPPTAYLTFKIGADSPGEAIAALENTYRSFFPGNPFDYYFLDEQFNRQYEAEQKVSSAFSAFSFIAIVIACLGLFGLASFEAVQRTKEIGVRKVLGASVNDLVLLFSRRFVVLLAVSSVVVLPGCYWLMDQWLNNYAYRMELGWLVFALPVLLLFVVAFGTLLYHTLRTARLNPVDALRSE